MSIVSSFVQAMADQAFPMLGEETLTVGAVSIPCVFAEIEDGKTFGVGYEVSKRLQAVCRTSDLPTESLLKKQAVARGVTMRVETVRKGVDFTTIMLEQPEKA